MTITEQFNTLITKYNELLPLLEDMETKIGTDTEVVGPSLTGRMYELEQLVSNTRQIVDDRLAISGSTFTTSYAVKGAFIVSIVDIVNGELCEVAAVESSDIGVGVDNKTMTLIGMP